MQGPTKVAVVLKEKSPRSSQDGGCQREFGKREQGPTQMAVVLERLLKSESW